MNKITNLMIAGIPVAVEHRYPLTSWECSGHETQKPPLFSIRADEREIRGEYQKLGGQFDMDDCESNILYRKAALGMLNYDGFLLHAASVALDGMGYVFTAPGGTGKSTHIGYWMHMFGKRASIINGDKPIIRYSDGKFYVCGTPWRGKERLGGSECVPLKAVCLLERGTKNSIVHADEELALEKLLGQLLPPEESEQIIKQLDLLDRLLREVPVYRLKCNMSPQAAITAYNGMNNSRE